MNKSIPKRLDRLSKQLLPDDNGKSWQIVMWDGEVKLNGPLITWRPGCPTSTYWPSEDQIAMKDFLLLKYKTTMELDHSLAGLDPATLPDAK